MLYAIVLHCGLDSRFREVMTGPHCTDGRRRRQLGAKQGAIGLLANADVQPEDARPIELGGAVEIAIVFGDDRGEREPARRRQLTSRVVAKEGIAPGDFGSPTLAGGDDDINARKRVGDVLGDRGFVHYARSQQP